MFLLITGASGVGKTTVRRLVQGGFARVLDAAELADVARPQDAGPQQDEPTPRRRHEAVELAVQRALAAQRERRHFLLCGDPVSPDEIVAAPSAERLKGIAVCLLDASEDAHRRRLFLRGDDPARMARHVAYADWLRAHLADARRPPRWSAHVIDTSELRDYEVAARVWLWMRGVIGLRARLRVAAR
jgi:broad-specificity NMP kinase